MGEQSVSMAGAAIILTTQSAAPGVINVYLILITASIPKSSPRWLPTRGSRSHPSLWLMDVVEQSVSMAGAAMILTTQSAAPLVIVVQVILITASIPKSSPRWLPTRGSRSHPSLWLMDVVEQSVSMAGAAII